MVTSGWTLEDPVKGDSARRVHPRTTTPRGHRTDSECREYNRKSLSIHIDPLRSQGLSRFETVAAIRDLINRGRRSTPHRHSGAGYWTSRSFRAKHLGA